MGTPLSICETARIVTIAIGMKNCEKTYNPAKGTNPTKGAPHNREAENECNEKVIASSKIEEAVCKAGEAKAKKPKDTTEKLDKVTKGQPAKVTVLDPSVDEKDKTTVTEKFTKPVEKLVAAEKKLAELKTKYADTLKTFKEQMENMDIKGAQATLVTLRSLVSEIQDVSTKMQTTMRDVVTASNQYDFPGEDILMRKARQSSSNIKSEGLALFKQYDKLFTSGIMKANTPFELTEAYGKFKAGE